MTNKCPFNYSGSKSGYIELHNIEEPIIDLFGGGGGFFSNVKSNKLIVNDVCEPLIGFQKMIYYANDEELKNIIKIIYNITNDINSKEEYEAMRKKFNESKDAIYFIACLSCCTNNLVRFNQKGGFNQTWGKRKFNPNMEDKLICFKERLKGKDIEFRTGSFENITENDGWLYFVDPPYIISEAGYSTNWKEADEKKLYEFLSDKQFILTNFIKKADRENTILRDVIENKGWFYKTIRNGSMKAQRKTDQTFEEVVVSNSQALLDKVKIPKADDIETMPSENIQTS